MLKKTESRSHQSESNEEARGMQIHLFIIILFFSFLSFFSFFVLIYLGLVLAGGARSRASGGGMGNPVRRSGAPKRAKKCVEKHPALPPPPPFLHLCRGHVYAPEPVTSDVFIRVPLQQLRNREAVNDVVLRSVLHRLHTTPSSSSHDLTATTHRCMVHVESIVIHADSARQTGYTGEVQLRATVAGMVARVGHGLLVGVAESSKFMETMVVCLQGGGPTGTRRQSHDDCNSGNADSHSGDNGVGNHGPLLVTARCLEEEPVVVGQTVLLVSEPGTLRCLAIRPPRQAPGPFRLHVGKEDAEIQASWLAKKKIHPGGELPQSRPSQNERVTKRTHRNEHSPLHEYKGPKKRGNARKPKKEGGKRRKEKHID
ncbi:hypothetical protein TRSC58_02103 [Trypanosoma rangeli SC58]|uniref:ICAM-like surface protein n=1 Tax=Trypanosoma rangeli SC58 TaxID=429131 RepID=A0A061J409_TRYRA|nr:hypothetical protein TRSC58_02103 [Trypanosoma rangeli SC58]